MKTYRKIRQIHESASPSEAADILMDGWDARIDAVDAEIRRLVALADRMEARFEEAQERYDAGDWEWIQQNLSNPDGA